MKLATYKDGSRDGQLVVVAADLSVAHHANGIATRLQQVLDDWNFFAPQLQDLAQTLEMGKARHAFPFDPRMCMAPLPRAARLVEAQPPGAPADALARWAGLSAEPAAGTEVRWSTLAGDALGGACDEAVFASARAGIDIGARLVVVTGDIAQGSSGDQALDGVRLLMLANQWTLRELQTHELRQGVTPMLGCVGMNFAPVAVTPDELGRGWQRGRASLAVRLAVNGEPLARLETGKLRGTTPHAGELMARLARHRPVHSGTLVSLGALGLPDVPGSVMEQRLLQAAEAGRAPPATPGEGRVLLQDGDQVDIDAVDGQGSSVFGALEQHVRIGS